MKSILISKAIIEKALSTHKSSGKKLLEPVRSLTKEAGLLFNILEDDTYWSDAEVHHTEADFWQLLEGEATFLIGGTLIDPQFRKNADDSDNEDEEYSKGINHGKEVILKEGDWLLIPKGEAHQHRASSKDGFARLIIIKVP